MAGILEGIRVVDMGHVVAIPATGAMFADWGAEVIKVEPLTGEMARGIRKSGGVDQIIKTENGEIAFVFQVLNRSKQGIALDLKKEAGVSILHRLIGKADVFMSNYELSSLNKFKLDYNSLSQLNPRLVYAILTGYGTAGPDKDERGFDYSAAWARSGMQYLIGEPGSPPPPQRPGMMDRVAAAHAAAGILAALLHREKTGRGQALEFSLYHIAAWVLATDIQSALMGLPIPKHDRTTAMNPIWNTYRTKDDRWFWLSMLQSDLHWPDFCRAIERPDLEKDPRFSDMEVREVNSRELIRLLDGIFVARSLTEWERRFRANNCIYGQVQSPLEVTADPQALANNFFTDIHHPLGLDMKLLNTPINFYQDPAAIKSPAPEIGQDTEAILLDLGYGWDDVARFKEQGVIL